MIDLLFFKIFLIVFGRLTHYIWFLTVENVSLNEFKVATKYFSTNIPYCFVFYYRLCFFFFFLGTFLDFRIPLKAKWFILFQMENFDC